MSAIKSRAVRRGRLLERISQQRSALAVELAPIVGILNTTDQVVAGAERTRRWIGENPIATAVGLVALLIWRPKGALGLAKKGLVSWRTLRLLRSLLA